MRSVNSQSRACTGKGCDQKRSVRREERQRGVARWQRPRDVVAHALHQHNQRRTESNRRCSDEQSTALPFVACRNGRTERSKRDPREKWIQPGCHQVLKPFDRVVNDDSLGPNRRALPCVHRMRSAHHSQRRQSERSGRCFRTSERLHPNTFRQHEQSKQAKHTRCPNIEQVRRTEIDDALAEEQATLPSTFVEASKVFVETTPNRATPQTTELQGRRLQKQRHRTSAKPPTTAAPTSQQHEPEPSAKRPIREVHQRKRCVVGCPWCPLNCADSRIPQRF